MHAALSLVTGLLWLLIFGAIWAWRRGAKRLAYGLSGTAALFIGIVAIAIAAGGGAEPEPAAAEAAASADPVTTTAAKPAATKPKAPKQAKPAAAKPKPAPVADTGRMSQGEYDNFQRVQAEVVDESLQFSNEYQACAVIGQTGDFAGFRECVQSGYSGFEEDADFALYTAQELLGDTAKKCRAALNSYVTVLNDYSATVKVAYEVANRLEFELIPPAFNELPKQARRYVKFASNVLVACEPR